MRIVRTGVTRTVILTRSYAIKVPRSRDLRYFGWFLRGWLANQSEWRQRSREGIARPVFTLFHFVTWYPRADEIGTWEPSQSDWYAAENDKDEIKGSSWGKFGESWRIIDYDRSWHPDFRSRLGQLYFGRQERMARKWLPESEEP